MIGDPALKVDRSRYLTFDLAEEWIRLTGKPFVFAFWAVRLGGFEECSTRPSIWLPYFRSHATTACSPPSLAGIAREWAPRLGLSEAEITSYLTENIYYDLDPACLDGLQLFYRYAGECGALPAAPPNCGFSMSPKLYPVPRAASSSAVRLVTRKCCL